jgi:folate-binding protein YgfZ
VFSKADIADASEQLKVYGFYGIDAATWLKNLFGRLPTQRFESINAENKTLIQLDEAGEQFELWLSVESAADVLANCTVAEGSIDNWTTTNINAGIGDVCAATQEEFIPQMLNMDITGAVSFSKGCYTGQEVVARMHYRGKSKRRMYSAQFSESHSANAIAEGAVVHIDGESQVVGHVVQASSNAALLVLTEEAAKQSKLQLGDKTVDLSFNELPYAVDEGKE